MNKAFIDTSVILRLLVKDDALKIEACKKLIKDSKSKNIILYLLPVAILEIVWVLEKVYKFERKKIREYVESILNTPELRVEMDDVFRNALEVYEEKNIKFADAVMGFWGLEKGFTTVYTYDEKDFKRIDGLEVKKP
ncbi:MAG: PIN domain-containing protein [Candidatus Firestonebacteria bacterium]|nr:PIN domain-containing protein [Candidatus Firestonebacteria bacterium]